MVTTIFIVRHGHTPLNVGTALRGRIDRPLDAEGLVEAHRLGELFVGTELAAVLAGPLVRARQTAMPIAAATGTALRIDDGLDDRDFGPWSGVHEGVVVGRFGSVDAAPGVEERGLFEGRVLGCFGSVANAYAGQRVALVTHDAVIAVLASTVFADDARMSEPMGNGTWTQLERDGGGWRAPVVGAVPGDGHTI